MKFLSILILALTFSQLSLAQQGDGDLAAIRVCLSKFQGHPFDVANPKYEVLKTAVKVLGVGRETKDLNITTEPKLILIKPNVTVLSKSDLVLMNPKGWYCLKGHVAILGKASVTIHCDAKITSSGDDTTVLADNQGSGTTVLGKTEVIRTGCQK